LKTQDLQEYFEQKRRKKRNFFWR